MSKEFVKEITSRDVDFAQWYTDIVLKAELCDYSSVKGCMVLRPTGYALWENIQKIIDTRLKETNHENVMMPMLIPESLLLKEAEHVEGFAPEVAWVTQGGHSELAERLAIRPTSEVMFAEHFRNVIHSYRDLPKLYNQWVSVVRWEKNTRPFLRTTEFFWQEGHTCHNGYEDADREARDILDMYRDVCENVLALPVVSGVKTESERFAGAVHTYTNETLMYDGKALQITTSHHLGQNFSIPFDITFLNKEGKKEAVHQSSWAITTRSIGGMIMVHGDDRGLVMPPRIAPTQIMIIPIAQHKAGVLDQATALKTQLIKDFKVKIDDSDKQPGWKFNDCEMKGVPVRLELGPRDIANNEVVVVRRDSLEKVTMTLDDQLNEKLAHLMDDIHQNMFNKAKERADAQTIETNNKIEFNEHLKVGGFAIAPWCGEESCEETIKEETMATARCMSFDNINSDVSNRQCISCQQPAEHLVHWARAY